ncbi:DsbA family protein, partial [Nanoarchaeota archaeon]
VNEILDEKKNKSNVDYGKIVGNNIWLIISGVLAVLLVLAIVFNGFNFSGATTSVDSGSGSDVVTPSGDQISLEEATNKAVTYLNKLMGEGSASAAGTVDLGTVFMVNLTVQGRTYESYVTKDGGMLFPDAIDLNEEPEPAPPTPPTEPEVQDVPKSDKPQAKGFIMSLCPYGLQFMKAYIPVIELLGEKADVEFGFVSYIMHGEPEIIGNNYMYCVQKENKAKLAEYMTCAVEAGDFEGCVEKSGIDKAVVDTCIANLDEEFKISELFADESTWSGGRFPQYPVEANENTEFGVGGSPTFILNGQKVSVNRSPEAIKKAICDAFNEAPEECSTALSSAAEAPGKGPVGASGGATANAAAGCGT